MPKYTVVFMFLSLIFLSAKVRAEVSGSTPASYKAMAKAKTEYDERLHEAWEKGEVISPALRSQIKNEVYKVALEEFKKEKKKDSGYIRELVREVVQEIKGDSKKQTADKSAPEKSAPEKSVSGKSIPEKVVQKKSEEKNIVVGGAQSITFERKPAQKEDMSEKPRFDVKSDGDAGVKEVTFDKPGL